MTIETNMPQLDAVDKVVTIVGLMTGVVPKWAETRDDLPKLICALTGMKEPEVSKAIMAAQEAGYVEYFGPLD